MFRPSVRSAPIFAVWVALAAQGGEPAAEGREDATRDDHELVASGTTYAIIHVENNGLDSVHCGSAHSPCRSISQAVANASAHDTIRVGPGRYGDLDQDQVLGERGEEGRNFSCQCMVNVNKNVRVLSSHGAAVSLVDAGGEELSGVVVSARGATFGVPDHGFTVINGGNGIDVQGADVSVAGNIVTANLQGVFVEGDGARVHHNVALLNEIGFTIQGSRAVLSSNSALGGVAGFALHGGDLDIRRNAAIGAEVHGIAVLEPGSSRLSKNSVIGNLEDGIFISESVPADIHENNIYGNGSKPSGFGPGLLNCGVINLSGPPPIAAQRNFWGAPNGPGRDPADAVCDLQTGDAPLIFSPAARKRFRILDAEALSGRKRSTGQ